MRYVVLFGRKQLTCSYGEFQGTNLINCNAPIIYGGVYTYYPPNLTMFDYLELLDLDPKIFFYYNFFPFLNKH